MNILSIPVPNDSDSKTIPIPVPKSIPGRFQSRFPAGSIVDSNSVPESVPNLVPKSNACTIFYVVLLFFCK